MTSLEIFLANSHNMHFREAILMHRLFMDVKIAAARSGYYLNTYFDDVDHDGFDVIFDDKDYLKKTQVKSVLKSAKTNSWEIHKSILRPSLQNVEKLGYVCSPEGTGSEGGVILIEFSDIASGLEVNYFYLDLFVLIAHKLDLIPNTHKAKKGAITSCIDKINQGLGNEKVVVPRAAFVQANNPNSLLALLGLHDFKSSHWKHQLFVIASHELASPGQQMELPCGMTLQMIKDQVKLELSNICS